MKGQRASAARRQLPPPSPSAKLTFDFYFGSRQHSTWEGAGKPLSALALPRLELGLGRGSSFGNGQPTSGMGRQGRVAPGQKAGLRKQG